MLLLRQEHLHFGTKHHAHIIADLSYASAKQEVQLRRLEPMSLSAYHESKLREVLSDLPQLLTMRKE